MDMGSGKKTPVPSKLHMIWEGLFLQLISKWLDELKVKKQGCTYMVAICSTDLELGFTLSKMFSHVASYNILLPLSTTMFVKNSPELDAAVQCILHIYKRLVINSENLGSPGFPFPNWCNALFPSLDSISSHPWLLTVEQQYNVGVLVQPALSMAETVSATLMTSNIVPTASKMSTIIPTGSMTSHLVPTILTTANLVPTTSKTSNLIPTASMTSNIISTASTTSNDIPTAFTQPTSLPRSLLTPLANKGKGRAMSEEMHTMPSVDTRTWDMDMDEDIEVCEKKVNIDEEISKPIHGWTKKRASTDTGVCDPCKYHKIGCMKANIHCPSLTRTTKAAPSTPTTPVQQNHSQPHRSAGRTIEADPKDTPLPPRKKSCLSEHGQIDQSGTAASSSSAPPWCVNQMIRQIDHMERQISQLNSHILSQTPGMVDGCMKTFERGLSETRWDATMLTHEMEMFHLSLQGTPQAQANLEHDHHPSLIDLLGPLDWERDAETASGFSGPVQCETTATQSSKVNSREYMPNCGEGVTMEQDLQSTAMAASEHCSRNCRQTHLDSGARPLEVTIQPASGAMIDRCPEMGEIEEDSMVEAEGNATGQATLNEGKNINVITVDAESGTATRVDEAMGETAGSIVTEGN
ncbi:hypothetical protein EDD16DRAFT_1517260 [Pisolithus croceorrhizus]|nr:hypothetical protein EV401DRAFT_1893076 [Pisolithus croceorrhizus]KAI6125014.1 hypothetical protein EDD16DRAFT_1517260 [Pisolithus croceorrhizus]KAI6161905.1 hypothetical protein EDD17DRAFT_1508749 [Pisolithus thermaeus]